jgi:hypothetical protein
MRSALDPRVFRSSGALDAITLWLSVAAFGGSLTLSILGSTTALAIFWPVWIFGTLLVCPMLLCWPLSLRARSVTLSVFLGSAGAWIIWLLLGVGLGRPL